MIMMLLILKAHRIRSLLNLAKEMKKKRWRLIAKLLRPKCREELKKKNITSLMVLSILMGKEFHLMVKLSLESIIVSSIRRTKKLRNIILTTHIEIIRPRSNKTMRTTSKNLKKEPNKLRLQGSNLRKTKKLENTKENSMNLMEHFTTILAKDTFLMVLKLEASTIIQR